MTNEQIAEQLYDELQHNKIINYNQYSDRLYELLDLAHPNEVVWDYESANYDFAGVDLDIG